MTKVGNRFQILVRKLQIQKTSPLDREYVAKLKKIRHIDWLGWRFVQLQFTRDMRLTKIYNPTELDTMRKILMAGYEDLCPDIEAVAAVLAVLTGYATVAHRINRQSDRAEVLITLDSYGADEPAEALREVQERGNFERELYLNLLKPLGQAMDDDEM